MHATGWSRGLDITSGGTGVVSHAGLALLRQLSDRTGLTSGLSAALPSPLGGHDQGRVLSDLARAIADGARVISDFRVMGDQRDVRAGRLGADRVAGAEGDRGRRGPQEAEGHGGGEQGAAARVEPRHRTARRAAAGQGRGRKLEGVTCIGLDATVVTAHRPALGRGELQGLRPSRSSRPAITWPSRWPGCCARARPGRTPRPITCACWARRSPRCCPRCAAG